MATHFGNPLLWLRISSTVTSLVHLTSESTKSSGNSFATGVSHWTPGFSSSITKIATAAAVNDFDEDAMSNNVEGVHGDFGSIDASPKHFDDISPPSMIANETPGT